jgi:hypothetical protein
MMSLANKIPSKYGAGLLSVNLGPELKEQWSAWCLERGFKPTTAIRSLVTSALADGLETSQKPAESLKHFSLGQSPDPGPKKDLRVYFTASEFTAIQSVSDQLGLGHQDFVIAAVRAALTQTPTYGQQELVNLIAANDALYAAVNALRIVKDTVALAPEVLESIEALREEIKRHTVKVSEVLAQGTRRWQLKV